MNARDLYNNVKVSPCINPAAAITGDGTTNGAIIDTQGFRSCVFVIQSGTITDGTMDVKLQDGDDSGLSDAADVAAANLIGTDSDQDFAATDDNETHRLGYRGSKRYVRVVLTQSGSTSGGFFAACCVQGDPDIAPVA